MCEYGLALCGGRSHTHLVFSSKNGTPILCVLDALENELYLLDQLGRASDTNERHGEMKVQVSHFGANAYSITTFLGSYLIQYTKQ